LIELVKNAYDADAKAVVIEIRDDVVRVADNGAGMTQRDFEKKWLRIGFSDKRRSKRSPSGERRVVGEKGVGRISADRLGSDLELRTVAHGARAFSAKVDWDAFDVDDRDLASIAIIVEEGVKPVLPPIPATAKFPEKEADTGTELLIRGLRQSWVKEDVDSLVEELSSLVAPFQEEIEFQITIETDIEGAFAGVVPPFVIQHAPLELRADLVGSTIHYVITDRTHDGNPKHKKGALSWVQVGPSVGASSRRKNSSPKPSTGPVHLELYFLPSSAFSKRPKGLSLAAAREKATGVRIYRDLVRVRPYGDRNIPEGDWLGLAARKSKEPAGVSRRTYKIPPTELAGAVIISRDANKRLQDSAAREGLIHNDAFHDLRALTIACLRELESYRHTIYRASRTEPDNVPVVEAVEGFSRLLRSAAREWKTIRADLDKNPVEAAGKASTLVATIAEGLEQTRTSLDAVVQQMRLYRGLSTLGISASVFGHETQNSIATCIGNLRESMDELDEAAPSFALLRETIPLAYSAAQRVAGWGAFAVARVRHEKRKPRDIDLPDVVDSLLEQLRPAYRATDTELTVNVAPVKMYAFEMDVEAILLNLLANAYTFAQESRRERKIRLDVFPEDNEGSAGVQLTVADSGPGVPENRREVIWEPLYTTRRDEKGNEVGTGLGLAIIDSIVREAGGHRNVENDPILGGARFDVWTPRRWVNA
jgi:hypothetical protein